MTELERLLVNARSVVREGKVNTAEVAAILRLDLESYLHMHPKGEGSAFRESHKFTVGDLLQRKADRGR